MSFQFTAEKVECKMGDEDWYTLNPYPSDSEPDGYITMQESQTGASCTQLRRTEPSKGPYAHADGCTCTGPFRLSVSSDIHVKATFPPVSESDAEAWTRATKGRFGTLNFSNDGKSTPTTTATIQVIPSTTKQDCKGTLCEGYRTCPPHQDVRRQVELLLSNVCIADPLQNADWAHPTMVPRNMTFESISERTP